MYKSIFRPLLFQFNPEKAHHITFFFLKLACFLPFGVAIIKLFSPKVSSQPKELWGLKFPNIIGLAAGLDKNAEAIDAFAAMGFGFVEIGTVTPKPQSGNPKPRLFRLKQDEALINRMGFNNDGVDVIKERLKRRKSSVIVGGNIGKNKITPNEEAVNDYLICFKELYSVVDYFVVNVSSPNTPGLRELQEKKPLTDLLSRLMEENRKKKLQKPILLKIAPDLTDVQLNDIVDIVNETKIAGVIATNTTIDRTSLTTSPSEVESIGNGGLSGAPVHQRSTDVIRFLHEKSNGSFPIIGVGGINSAQRALDKIEAGASMIQLYSGFIYEGPRLIQKINNKMG
ncbi:quinone-dependent dihydroorotate dehydrogenase [Reichenbachiella agarivorans]|uniref:Dihydroorotate dehydrogenase (quinone) n=1 Tax=Reichenbachiella agarivorans TaxID=2979464 RepID=A0ABY6CU00_9BACT|nr:quinone-dependent dihydroorotate dehydrogenase [Reichenbachiella agarivorans]UXP33992.1 quinone-dependent dihydroorotate dehydrogenase [Reichenbachiella agarivorans]